MSRISDEDLEEVWCRNAELPETVSAYVQDIIIETARGQPFAPCVCAWDGAFNYEQLIILSSQMADHISDRGIQPGTVLPLCMKKSKWMPVAMLGALMADCGVALFGSDTPHQRLSDAIELLGSRFVLTTSETKSSFDSIVTEILVDSVQFNERRPCDFCTYKRRYASVTAAIVFTSGSTGSPKGVMLSPQCLSTTAVYGSKLLQLHQASRVFHFSSYSFDISLHESLMTFVAGGCLCIPSEAERLDNTISAINAFGSTWICITPSAASSILNEVASTPIETVVFTGEAITARVSHFVKKCRVFCWYGASEVPLVSVAALKNDSFLAPQIGSGYPGACWIVKPDDPEVLSPVGEVGELLIEGPMQTDGYLHSPEKTREAFVTNPIWLAKGSSKITGRSGRLYKSGDLVKYNGDGTLSYISRKDTLVKIRGQRVELGEVEHQIWNLLCAGDISSGGKNINIVADAIKPAASAHVMLVSFVCICENPKNVSEGAGGPLEQPALGQAPDLTRDGFPAPSQSFSVLKSALDQKLRGVLPEYMVPSVYFEVHSLPVTPSGKINRKLLRSIAERLSLEDLMPYRVSSLESSARPRDEIEQKLCDLWAKINGISGKAISTNMSFGQCGGDSLRAITLVKALEKDFGISTKVAQIIRKETTIQHLATLIRNLRSGKQEKEQQIDLNEELSRWRLALSESCTIAHPRAVPSLFQMRRVFLTGATGYLGTHILSQLVSSQQVEKVIVLVRADDIGRARERIREVATISGWWSESASRYIDIWVGDLAEPRLGLDEEKWNALSLIDTIIHNGAVVNWGADYHGLEPVNVRSTFQILQAGLQSSNLRRFVYVSGGMKQEQNQTHDEYIRNLNGGDGYSQTKYISEQLVKTAGRLYHQPTGASTPVNGVEGLGYGDKVFTVVKPGYIIGDHTTGLSNIDDFLWRVVAGAVRMRSFPQEPDDSWLDVAEITHVARCIVRQCHFAAVSHGIESPTTPEDDSDNNGDWTGSSLEGSSDATPMTSAMVTSSSKSSIFLDDIGRGLPVSRFWAAVQAQIATHLEPKDWKSWVDLAHRDMEHERESHPLWGIQQFLGQPLGSSSHRPTTNPGSETPLSSQGPGATAEREVEAAVRRCVQYLVDVNFIIIATSPAAVVTTEGNLSSSRKRKREDTEHAGGEDHTVDHDQHQHRRFGISRTKFIHL